MEVASQPVERAPHPFMAIPMHRHHDLLDQGRSRRDVQPPRELDHAVDDGPGRPTGSCTDVVPNGYESWVGELRLAKAIDEVETWR